MTETITGVAILLDGIIHQMPRPARHFHLVYSMFEQGYDSCLAGPEGEGFVTSTGRWVNRTEALAIAMAAGQVAVKVGNPTILFSEDLW